MEKLFIERDEAEFWLHLNRNRSLPRLISAYQIAQDEKDFEIKEMMR